jgi:hypothetical protein
MIEDYAGTTSRFRRSTMNHESAICAANGVQWYQAIFGSHGLSGAIADGMWTSRDKPPPFYSNAVTVASSPVAAQAATIRDLGGTLPRPRVGSVVGRSAPGHAP